MYIDISDLGINLDNITVKIYILKTFFISICTYFTFLKILNNKKEYTGRILSYILIFLITIVVAIVRYKANNFMSIVCLILFLSLLHASETKNNIGYSILITTISLSFNYSIFFISIVSIFIFNIFFTMQNDFLNLLLMMMVHLVLLCVVFRIKKFKYGISFFRDKSNNECFDMLILNLSVCILFSVIILSNINISISKSLFIAFILFAIIMFITIQKSLQLYYKQKLLVQELNETKEELENKKKEIEQLEQENLNFSKTSHSLAHKQKSLEYKLNQLMMKSETGDETELKDRLNNISKELYNDTAIIELSKTGIPEIDDMLKYMQSECTKNKIEFELQIKGNIHQMVNNFVSKEDLEILIADHIKNAIIAINYSDNINRSILVRLGKIDEIYSLYIYDSGIEFEKETLENLGKKPSTTHADNGGTGMGFMNTFDTLRKYKASLIIHEINKPNKDNYTKAIIIKFDKKQKFEIDSYREEKINSKEIKSALCK